MIDYANIITINFPSSKWRIENSFDYNTLIWMDNTKKPTQEELEILNTKTIEFFKKQNCKDKAKQLIASSDWSVLPDVNISNKSEFESYRTQLRNLIINPVEDPIFPVEPNPIWSNN